MKKMLMLATTAAMIEQFNKNNILILEEMGYEVHVAGNWQEGNPISKERLEEFKGWIDAHHGKWFHITATRRPTDFKNNGKAYHDVVGLIKKYKYDFVHCHTPIGSIIGRFAAKKTCTKIIYTAHGFHFFKGAPLKNWFLYFPVEWICSWMTDVLITINKEDYRCAQKYFHAKKTEYIPGVGIDIEKFSSCHVVKMKKCRELGIPSDKFILLSVGDTVGTEKYKSVIEVLGKTRNSNIYYLIVGNVKPHEEYEQLIKKYHLEGNVKILGYRTDIDELCEIADCFVYIRLHEGVSVALLEAMASGLPVISSDAQGIYNLMQEGKGGFCLYFEMQDKLQSAIMKLYTDVELRESYGAYNYETVKKYCVHNINKIMFMIGGFDAQLSVKHLEIIIESWKLRESLNIALDHFVIISVGELNVNKNHEVIIRAIAELHDPSVKYIICGQGELKGYLESIIKRCQLENQVMLLGYRADIKKLLNMADLFVFPSKREGLSMALMEAMACGLPILCYPIRGNVDLLGIKYDQYGKISFNVDFTEKIRHISNLPMKYRRKMGMDNIVKINQFDIHNVNERMITIYRAL